MPYEGQYNRKTKKVWSSMTGGWDIPMPGFNLETIGNLQKGKEKKWLIKEK